MHGFVAILPRRTRHADNIRQRYGACHHSDAHTTTTLRSRKRDKHLRDITSAFLRLLGQEGGSLCMLPIMQETAVKSFANGCEVLAYGHGRA